VWWWLSHRTPTFVSFCELNATSTKSYEDW
jgi:hypothetical protein